jgi:mycoredoxin-dependent peroxiredoxin
MPLTVGTPAPDFSLRNQHRAVVSLDDLKGARAVIVFIPFAFTSTCQSELCSIRDNLQSFNDASTRVVVITCNTHHSNRVWAEQQGFEFDILSDFWPHGAVATAYEAFNELVGAPNRITYFLDEEGTIVDVIASDGLGASRPIEAYQAVLAGPV